MSTYVYKAWLDGGDNGLVEQRCATGSASTDCPRSPATYKAWLDAGGDKGLVDQSMRDWLGQRNGLDHRP